MKYHKPQINSSQELVPAIRGHNRKFLTLYIHALSILYVINIIAYETDE